MTELESRCLDAFPAWLAALTEDATSLAELLSAESLPHPARLLLAGAVLYLFKSLDLIPDGHEELGYLDDAFVLRVAARLASEVEGAKGADPGGLLARLAADGALIDALLGPEAGRLERYVRELAGGAAHGRTTEEIAALPEARAALLESLHAWAKAYQVPAFTADEKNLVTLRAFLGARLPAGS